MGQLVIPRTSRESLEMVTPFVVIQMFVYSGKLVNIEICVNDLDKTRRRLIFTQSKQIIRNTMHARIPNSFLNRNIWTDLCIDVSSVFSMCFPGHTFRDIDTLTISGSLKLRKIIGLMKPADLILPGITEVPKFSVVSQMIDLNLFPDQSPKYFSSSPIKHVNKEMRENMFKRSDQRLKKLTQLKREYLVRANVGPRAIFKSPKLKKIEALERKITHNYSKQPDNFDEIEENIIIEGNSWEDELMKKQPSKIYDYPEFYLNKVAEVCSHRHQTPPFLYTKDNLSYNPLYRYYENL
jgi:hypothetical protein